MNIRSISAAIAIAASALTAGAQTPWIHVYTTETKGGDKDTDTKSIGFPSMPVSSVRSLTFTPVGTSATSFKQMVLKGGGKTYTIPFGSITEWVIGPNVPTFRFYTNPSQDEVESKTDYLGGTVNIDGAGLVDNVSGAVMQIRGRGNSTWNYPKKAYRVKFPEKIKICGFRKAKNYVLLANFLDPTLMRNQVAFTAAQLAGMPYPNHAMAVDVWFNDGFKGSYMLTEKCGFNNGSVDLSKEDEANSIMFELDTNFDEDMRQVSTYFALPVNLKDPDAPADPIEADAWWSRWMADFETMEEAVFTGKGIADHIDYTSLARYLITFNIACNQELNHPKSVYLYKTEGGKYQFGPAWDFDWAFGYQPTYRHIESSSMSAEERRALIDRALEEAGKHPQGSYFTFDELMMVWYGGEDFIAFNLSTGAYYPNWPDDNVSYAPSYENYLLGAGKNSNNSGGMGNGGEFFLSIIIDNPEFMAVYAAEWEAFKARLDDFWKAFDDYAGALRPSHIRNQTVWPMIYSPNPGNDSEFYGYDDYTRENATAVLRAWVAKRLEFIGDPANNYGLYDPATDYKPAGGKR